MNKKHKINRIRTSKTTEMIPSMFNWVNPDVQNHIANHLANVTKTETSDEVAKKIR